MPDRADRQTAQERLFDWYAKHHRTLPWRDRPTPYGVLVSELMLQQTRVDTVLGYYERWMARWPTLADLAAADLQDVLAQWTGLGYYNRARNLHKTAQLVVRDHGGQLPSDAASLAQLPGLGPYTLGAVRSIAFGEPAALVDGNVSRVFSRWHAQPGQPQPRWLWQTAQDWLALPTAQRDPGTWNQALMELGATVCTPRKPACAACPVQPHCLVFAQDLQEAIPPARVRAAPKQVTAAYAIVAREGRILLGRRPAKGRWAGLWEPPGLEGAAAGVQLGRWLLSQGLQADRALPALVHVLTHRRYEVESLVVVVPPGHEPDLQPLGYVEQRWQVADDAQSQTSGLSRLGQRLCEQAGEAGEIA